MEFGAVCPSLPSSDSALGVFQGRKNAWWCVARDFVVRSALCSAGIYLAGQRDARAIRYGAGAAAFIEVTVFGYIYYRVVRPMRREQAAEAARLAEAARVAALAPAPPPAGTAGGTR
jgi:hypothetical protein